jgi:hypothetical protein
MNRPKLDFTKYSDRVFLRAVELGCSPQLVDRVEGVPLWSCTCDDRRHAPRRSRIITLESLGEVKRVTK